MMLVAAARPASAHLPDDLLNNQCAKPNLQAHAARLSPSDAPSNEIHPHRSCLMDAFPGMICVLRTYKSPAKAKDTCASCSLKWPDAAASVCNGQSSASLRLPDSCLLMWLFIPQERITMALMRGR